MVARLSRIVGGLAKARMYHLWAARALCAAVAVAYLMNAALPGLGAFGDDAVYVSAARALSNGAGYVIDTMPGDPPLTKYPPLFPAALSVLWRLDGAFPGNVWLFKAFVLLLAVVWLALSYRLARRFGLGQTAAWWVVCLTALHPWTLYTSTNVISEIPYAVLAAGALLASTYSLQKGGSLWWTVLLAVAAGLSYLTRTAGAALLLACLPVFAARRMWKQLAICAAVWSPLVLGWKMWQQAQVLPTDTALLFLSHHNYDSWWVFNLPLATGLTVAFRNLLLAVSAFPQPIGLEMAFMPVFLVAGGLLCLVAAREALREWNGTGAIACAWLAISFAVSLAWTWAPARFLLPCFPVLVMLFLRAMCRVRQKVDLVLAAALLTGYVVGAGREIPQSVRLGQKCGLAAIYRQPVGQWDAAVRAANWLKQNTPAEAVFGSNSAGLYSLLSGRKGVWTHAPDPLALFYGGRERDLEDDRELAQAVRRFGIRYLLPTEADGAADQGRLRRAVGRWTERRPECLQLSYTDPVPGYEVYRVACAP
jgi:hypothetical protein